MVRAPCFQSRGPGSIQIGKVRSHVLCNATKKQINTLLDKFFCFPICTQTSGWRRCYLLHSNKSCDWEATPHWTVFWSMIWMKLEAGNLKNSQYTRLLNELHERILTSCSVCVGHVGKGCISGKKMEGRELSVAVPVPELEPHRLGRSCGLGASFS